MARFSLMSVISRLAIIGAMLASQQCVGQVMPTPPPPPTQTPGLPPIPDRPPDTPPPFGPAIPEQAPQPQTGGLVPQLNPEDIQIDIPPLARTITFTGNTILSSEELRRVAGIKSGQLITQDALSQAVENIQTAYRDKGYIAAVTDIQMPRAGQVGTLNFNIVELRLSDVRLQGLVKVRENTVRRILSMKPGMIFNREAVIRDYVQLQQLGVFEDLAFELQPGTEPGKAVLVWTFRELENFNYASIGGSYGPSDGLVGSAQLTLGNLGGRAERLDATVSVASADVQPGGKVDYYNPWIAPRSTSLLLSVFSNVRYRFSRDITTEPGEDRYFERHSGFRAAVNRQQNSYLTLGTGFRFEVVDVNNLPSDMLTDPTAQDTTLLLANLRSIWDFRNSAAFPTTGTYTTAFLEGGLSRLSTSSDGIAKLWGDRRWFLPLREIPPGVSVPRPVPVLALRAMLAGSIGSLPFSEQYFVGGISDLPLRGYLEGRYWGKYALVGSAEYRYPFSRSFTGVGFVDVGDAWGSDFLFIPGTTSSTSFTQHENFSPKLGVGIGLRYGTAIGPIRVDFARGDAYRLHVSVGQTF
ncbi:MAG: BamA/TamA family outer membrane protein [Armatimonadota bacterium]|nr:BamA/TamA family outer membrane protein [bacterium]